MEATSTSDSLKCDYLPSHARGAFASEQAELVHINEQIRSLDSHITQLKTLRYALYHRSCKLHNLLAPIHSLPIEVLSHIFKHAVNSGHYGYERYRICLEQALLFSRVSAHFRHVAFGTPELWKGIAFCMVERKPIGQVSSLIQHCMTLTANINISIYERLTKEQARSAIEILLTPDVTRRIKAFEIITTSNLWIEKLKGPSFPILDSLDITCGTGRLNLDLGTLNTVTRVGLYELDLRRPIIMPPSIRHLIVRDLRQQSVVDILYQCPNLEGYHAVACRSSRHFLNVAAQFDKPLTLTHLKRLTLDAMNINSMASSTQNLCLPSLEYLELNVSKENEFINVVQFCHNVSSTLTTFIIHTFQRTITYDDLYQLCGSPFPKLKKLRFAFHYTELMLKTIRALTQRVEECGNVQPHYLPSLTTLTLKCGDETEPRCLLGLLERWRVGETSIFYLDVEGFDLDPGDWSPEVKEELKSVVGTRQVEVTWGRFKVQ